MRRARKHHGKRKRESSCSGERGKHLSFERARAAWKSDSVWSAACACNVCGKSGAGSDRLQRGDRA